jgi:hypothetical protein
MISKKDRRNKNMNTEEFLSIFLAKEKLESKFILSIVEKIKLKKIF